MHTSLRAAGIVAGLTLTLGSIGSAAVASADEAKPAACSQQQKQLDKAHSALDRATAVFARQQDKVKKAEREEDDAASSQEHRRAERDLSAAKHARKTAETHKSAQQQRVEKAQARLDTCEAAQPVAG